MLTSFYVYFFLFFAWVVNLIGSSSNFTTHMINLLSKVAELILKLYFMLPLIASDQSCISTCHSFSFLALSVLKYLSVWRFFALYCRAATLALKEEIEGLQELDKSVEILVRLLCAVPGWNEKNVQVCLFFFFGGGKYAGMLVILSKSSYCPPPKKIFLKVHVTWKCRFSNRSLKSSLTYHRLRRSFLRNVSYFVLRVRII